MPGVLKDLARSLRALCDVIRVQHRQQQNGVNIVIYLEYLGTDARQLGLRLDLLRRGKMEEKRSAV